MHFLSFMLICLALSSTPGATLPATMKAAVPVQRVFGPEHPGGRYKHPASITQLADGDLYLVYYTGSGEYATDTAVYGARLPKGRMDWASPVPIADTPFRSEGNPVVWQAPGRACVAVLRRPLRPDLVHIADSGEDLPR